MFLRTEDKRCIICLQPGTQRVPRRDLTPRRMPMLCDEHAAAVRRQRVLRMQRKRDQRK